MSGVVKPDGNHLWVGAEHGVYCWWCGRSRLPTTPEQCKADNDIPLYRWFDGSLHGGPESIIENVISASYGNDSMALIQWAHENKLPDVTVCYCDTGWAAKEWPARVEVGEALALMYGFKVHQTTSMGFAELVRMKKGFPANGLQFCTAHLKGIPFLEWIDEADKECKAVVLIGKRRAESESRKDIPEYVPNSEYHGGRTIWHPLYLHTDEQRNELLARAGLEPLLHRSKECNPCVNANRGTVRRLTRAEVEKVAELETEIGKPMFRPERFGATGIHQVVRWAKYSPGQFAAGQDDLFGDEGCGSPFGCGS